MPINLRQLYPDELPSNVKGAKSPDGFREEFIAILEGFYLTGPRNMTEAEKRPASYRVDLAGGFDNLDAESPDYGGAEIHDWDELRSRYLAVGLDMEDFPDYQDILGPEESIIYQEVLQKVESAEYADGPIDDEVTNVVTPSTQTPSLHTSTSMNSKTKSSKKN